MPTPPNRNDRLLSNKDRKLSRGIGPKASDIPKLKQNKPGKSIGIGYSDDGFSPNINTAKHIFKT